MAKLNIKVNGLWKPVADLSISGGGDSGTASPHVSDLAVSVSHNSVSITFKTNILAWRLIEYGTTESSLVNTNSGNAYRTEHTVGLSDLTPSTKYFYKLTLTNEDGSGVTVTEISSFTTSAEPVTSPGTTGEATALPVDRSMYPAGWENWPIITWRPTASNKKLVVPNDQGYRIYCPDEVVDIGNIEIYGGWRYIVFGLQSRMTKCHFGPYSPGYHDARPNDVTGSGANTFLRIIGRVNEDTNQNTKPVFKAFEGLYMKGDYFWEGINYDRRSDANVGDTVVIQNFRCERVSWVHKLDGKHEGGDVFQPWNGPSRLYVRNVTGYSHYQGFFLQAGGNSTANLELLDLKRIELRGGQAASLPGIYDGHTTMIWCTYSENPNVTYVIGEGSDGVYLNTRTRSRSQTLYAPTSGAIWKDKILTGDVYPTDANANRIVYVPADKVGLNYLI